ncbi:hypothetical protein L6164_027181 [Bauhinia variegata]|uniref:Uncharacterized protein n=1 Tax=Bauhinia variegata TaxID=167791 RepID=A0ACB9LTW4_BAUVA|nr:hypothetical protein L6164_027181 [Bauhinia variegata]
MSRTCSQCGNNGHNSRTCTDSGGSSGGASNGIMLFGVRLTEGGSSFRKSASMTNLSQFDHEQQPQDSNPDAGYASDDVVHPSGRSRERKRGVPWTEDEHRLFLLGLQKVGKGDWRGISRSFVKTRTPTQVASHAQKYFLRRHNQNRRRRRSSLFDITTETVMKSSKIMDEDQVVHQEAVPPTHPQSHLNHHQLGHGALNFSMTSLPPVVVAAGEKPIENLTLGPRVLAKPIRPTPLVPVPVPVPPSGKMANLNLKEKSAIDPLPLSLKPPTPNEQSPTGSHSSPALEGVPGKFSGNGDNIISVA